MHRLSILLCLLLVLTACAPQVPMQTAMPTPTVAPTQTSSSMLTAEDALQELLQDYEPQSLNMFRPFKPIEITPEQFAEEMAAIRALPMEERTDWFTAHGLCIPQPSEDTDTDWQKETNLWSTFADYRTTVISEPISGYTDGVDVQWTFVCSEPANYGGAARCAYTVLFEQKHGQPWYLIDILYRPQVWEGRRTGPTLLSMQTENTLSFYDPALRSILLTVPAGEIDVQNDTGFTRYVFDSWKWYPSLLERLRTDDLAVIHLLYESYPEEPAELASRTDFGGCALVYEMQNLRPVLVKNVRCENCDTEAFLDTRAEDFLHDDYRCPAYSTARGDQITITELQLTETRVLTAEFIGERTQPLQKYWHDEPFPITRIHLFENGELLQTIEIAELARLAAAHTDTEVNSTQYPETVPYHFSDKIDFNLDGYNDLQIYFQEITSNAYHLLWDEQTQQYIQQNDAYAVHP